MAKRKRYSASMSSMERLCQPPMLKSGEGQTVDSQPSGNLQPEEDDHLDHRSHPRTPPTTLSDSKCTSVHETLQESSTGRCIITNEITSHRWFPVRPEDDAEVSETSFKLVSYNELTLLPVVSYVAGCIWSWQLWIDAEPSPLVLWSVSPSVLRRAKCGH